MQYEKQKRPFPLMMIITIVTGIIYSLIGNAIYNGLINKIPAVFVIALYFLGLAIVVSVVIFITNLLSGNLPNKVSTGALFLCIGLMFILGLGFEFIYQLGGKTSTQEPDAFIFVIDNSGSMSVSDPDQHRISALQNIVQSRGNSFPYAVYGFNDNVEILREMAPVSNGLYDTKISPENGTAIKKALNTVYDDISSGKIHAGKNCRVLLLSDGAATDCGELTINSVLKKYSKAGITICTVGLGNADESMLKRIAEKTGGGYVHADSSTQLSEAIKVSIESQSDRDLLNVRFVKSLNWLYMIERILFIFILGLIMGFIRVILSNERDQSKQLVVSIFLSIIGALAIELGLNLFGMPLLIGRMLMCVCFALTLATQEKINITSYDDFSNGENHFGDDDSNTNNFLRNTDLNENDSSNYLSR